MVQLVQAHARLSGDVAQVAAGGGEVAAVKGPAACTAEGTKYSATRILFIVWINKLVLQKEVVSTA